ncbi:uncharacterized protein LOC115787179 [Archocentrus centrarchus]|uniref:uncharacterized protein LOC115787179 n=1 Tax=Archocentrus centrarchus TaxID=63155 RepID=UPI0011E9D6D1|nr:uncharacterized protein LOC115787179 [Archocentrus centrarchus]
MWMRMFSNYLLVINATGNAWPDARKRATLLHCLGAEGQRIFYCLTNTGDTFSSAVAALEKHFSPKVNIVVERHAFRKRTQAPHETVEQYVTALRDLGSKCDFDDKTEEMIRDQLVEHISNSSIRERLLLEPDLTLDKAVTLAAQMESAAYQAKALTVNSNRHVQAIQSRSYSATQRNKSGVRPVKSPSATSTPAKSCFRCGSNKHLANARQCPAAKATCNLCQKVGHFARVCCSSKTRQVREVQLPDLTVLYLGDTLHASKTLQCDIELSTPTSPTKTLRLTVDTGSAVSILPHQTYKEHFIGTPLCPPDLRLVTYTKKTIPVLGCLQVEASRGITTTPATFFVVKQGTPLLGRDLMETLHICIAGGAVLPPCTAPAAPVMTTDGSPTSPIPAAPDIGCVKSFVHKVKLDPSVKPVRQKLRRLPFAVRAPVAAELDRLLKAGVIEQIDASPWVSPIVVTGRKTGGIRLCADLREPNKAVITDCYPLPHVDELFVSLQGATLFSTIDLANAYYQLPLHEDSRDLTAFITHEGLFRFRRVPYGLASAPSAFQKMMSEILQGLPGVQNYLDDLIIYGKTPAEHDSNLNAVLHKLKTAGLVLNENKCHYRKTSLRFLGHVITADGILPDKEHIDAVLNAPPPTDAAALRSFLGLVSWYSKFLPNFATIVAPMRSCGSGTSNYVWTTEAQKSFEEIKQLLVNSPALALFNPNLRIVISTDASDYGLGAVFAQVQPDGTEKPVAFASRTLSAPEQKYSTVEKEALACVWATEKWRTYLWGRRFTLRTDHQALTTLLSTKGMNRAGMRIARWSARLLCFDYDVVYRPGSQNYTADCLSRLPLPVISDLVPDADPEMVCVCKWKKAGPPPLNQSVIHLLLTTRSEMNSPPTMTTFSESPRLCVDYRPLNERTIKDAYPLPRIQDTLDTLSTAKYFSTLDLTSGYWQDSNQMLERLEQVFARLCKANLKLKPSKCCLFREQVAYLGHIISAGGIATDPQKVQQVIEWPAPRNVTEVRQFVGLASYYRRFVEDFATIAKPLHELTKMYAHFKWTAECQEAFEELKRRLTVAPILGYPLDQGEFLLDTDASDCGIGAVLSQVQGGEERVLAYGSRRLSATEQNYCTTRRELLAVVEFTSHFRQYLLGRPFTVRTDHSSLRWLTRLREPEGQLARWLEKLAEYDFKVLHRPGKSHQNADALSRRPCRTSCTCMAPDPKFNSSQFQHKGVQCNLMDPPTVINPPGHPRVGVVDPQVGSSDGSVGHPSIHRLMMQQMHDGPVGGHFGAERTLARLKNRYYWYNMKDDVTLWCRTCTNCAAKARPLKTPHAAMGTVRVGAPMERIAVDLMGPLNETERHNRFILVVQDYFSKWVEAYAVPNEQASTVAEKIVSEWSDGQVERFNATLQKALAATAERCHWDWDIMIPYAVMAYRATKHSSTGLTPNMMLFGREVTEPLDLVAGLPPDDMHNNTLPHYVVQLRERLELSHQLAREALGKSSERAKRQYDKNSCQVQYPVGAAAVWYLVKGTKRVRHRVRKFLPSYEGPYFVIGQLDDLVYRIKKGPRTKAKVVHHDRLKPYHSRTLLDNGWVFQEPDLTAAAEVPPPTPDEDDPDTDLGPLNLWDTQPTADGPDAGVSSGAVSPLPALQPPHGSLQPEVDVAGGLCPTARPDRHPPPSTTSRCRPQRRWRAPDRFGDWLMDQG